MKSSLPRILLVTTDDSLSAELIEEFEGVFTTECCGSLAETAQFMREPAPWGMVADFRHVVDGGHAEDRFLESVQNRFPQMHLAVISADEMPEPIQRRIVCSNLQFFRNPKTTTELAGRIMERLDNAVAQTTAVEPPSTEAGVLNGLTRKFETSTPAMQQMLGELETAAKYDVTVMLIGETGSGKTFLSKLVHEVSPRRDEPFLTVACGALPDNLIESELFGHTKGAFTGAHSDKEGKFLAAGSGTILLDEIDVLFLEQQVKLLRVIESGEFEPVGSNQTLKSRARIIVASNLDLQPLVEQGRFRPDLYYRLNMLKFDISPLRDRMSDIVPLAVQFVEQLSKKHRVPIDRIDDSVFDVLLSYPWPGNVRELENVIQRAVIYCRDRVLRVENLPAHITAGIAGPANDATVVANQTVEPAQSSEAKPDSLQRQVAFTEQEIIENALLRNSQSRTRTAKDLGISRVTLYNKMKKYSIMSS